MKLARSRHSRQRGAALLYAIFAAMAAAAMVSVLMTVSLSTDRSAVGKREGGQSRYMSEGAVEVARRDVTSAIANWQAVPATGQVTIDGTQVDYTVTPTGFATIETEPSGVQKMITGYQIEARSTVGGTQSTVHRLINSEAIPIFQYAVFYTNDLEINPPLAASSQNTQDAPRMFLHGRIHSNADMYLNCGGTMTINSNYVRAVGDLYRIRKGGLPSYDGVVQIRQWVADPFDPAEPFVLFDSPSQLDLTNAGVPSVSGYDSDFAAGWDGNGDGDFDDVGDWYPWATGALNYWSEPSGYAGGSGYTVMTGDHNVPLASTPFIGSISMYEPDKGGTHFFDASSGMYLPAAAGKGTHSKGYYHSQADLSIITAADGSIAIFDASGVDITSTLPSFTQAATLYDARQAGGGTGDVAVTQIDLAALSGFYPTNGLIYTANYGAGTGTNVKGFQLLNGADLDAPLTVVSENSIYVTGDYNVANKKGAAVIADAVNLLSNSWDGSKAAGSALPVATPTTYNVAIVTGNVPTQNGQYSGGLENLPRLHEDWDDVKLKLVGSLVNTWESKYATAEYHWNAPYYLPPDRHYYYDKAFNNVANLPPFTPMAVSAEDVAVW